MGLLNLLPLVFITVGRLRKFFNRFVMHLHNLLTVAYYMLFIFLNGNVYVNGHYCVVLIRKVHLAYLVFYMSKFLFYLI